MTTSCMYLIACGCKLIGWKKNNVSSSEGSKRERERSILAHNLDG
jgi:hypothetical protein